MVVRNASHCLALAMIVTVLTLCHCFAAKQSTMVTFLEDGFASGNLKLYDNAYTEKLLFEEGKAVGALATVTVRGSCES